MRISFSVFLLVSILLSILKVYRVDANEQKRSPVFYGDDGLKKRGSGTPKSYGFQERAVKQQPPPPPPPPQKNSPSPTTKKATPPPPTTTTTGKTPAQITNNSPTTTATYAPSPTGATQTSEVASGSDDQLNGEQPKNSPSSQQGDDISAGNTVPTGGVSSAGIILIATVGGVFVLSFGLFAFVRKKRRQEMTETIVATSASAWEQQNSTYEKVEEKPVNSSYSVIRTYIPTLSDELDIQLGDKVTILEEYDDGWVQGINETRGGAKGVFPRHCVDMNISTNNKRTSSVGTYTVVDLN